MERIKPHQSSGINAAALKNWGIAFLTAGIISRAVLEHQLLQLGSPEQLLEMMKTSQSVMGITVLSFILQAIAKSAVPIFSLLLLRAFEEKDSFRELMLRVLGIAVISEIPYNLAISGSWLEPYGRNPVFGLVLALFLLYGYERFPGKSVGRVLIKLVLAMAALGWCYLLNAQDSIAVVLVVSVMWAFRNKKQLRNLSGMAVTLACSAASPFYLASPMGFLAVHFYNGEPEPEKHAASDLAYPVLLLVFAAAAILI